MVKAVPLPLRILARVFVAVTVLGLLAPLIVVVAASVSENQYISFPPQGFSLIWYRKVLSSDDYMSAAALSFGLALAVTVAATLIGGAAAIAIHRRKLPYPQLIGAVFISPLMLPTIIYAIGMLMLWSSMFGVVTVFTLWISHTIIATPYVVRTTLAVLSDSDPFLEEAARTMGANRLQRLMLVVVPQCLPGLAAGAFFAFNLSFDEAVLSLFLRKPDLTTLPVEIYSKLEFSPDPSVAAVSSIMIALTVVLIIVIDRVVGIKKFAST